MFPDNVGEEFHIGREDVSSGRFIVSLYMGG